MQGDSGQIAVSRRQLLATAGAATGAAAVLAACGGDSGGSDFGDGDAGALNLLLTVEYVESALYGEIAAKKLFSGSDQSTIEKFQEEEEEHVAALTKAVERLEGDPASEPQSSFDLGGGAGALRTAATLENLAAAAYLGQLPLVKNASALETLLSIHSVEGRHAATIATMLGGPITPDGAFAKPASAKAVVAGLEPFIAS